MKANDLQKRPPRSQPTRDRILQAARLIFGRDGYDHATIRAIAAEAKINPAMVMRYYVNKESLFAAATQFGVNPEAFASVPMNRLGEALVRYMVDSWENPDTGPTRRAVLLTALSNEAVRTKYIHQLQGQYITALLKQAASSKRAQEAIALMRTQILGMMMTRYILRVPTMTAIPQETLIREIGRVLQGYIRLATT
jgi:AcrR family transcriptional regulator